MDYNFRADRSQHKHFSCVSLSYAIIKDNRANERIHQPEAYSGVYQISMMERFAKIVKG